MNVIKKMVNFGYSLVDRLNLSKRRDMKMYSEYLSILKDVSALVRQEEISDAVYGAGKTEGEKQFYRDKINELEAEIKELKKQIG